MNKKNKKLAIDIDGVVFPFIEIFKHNACQLYGICDLPDPEHFTFEISWADRQDLTDDIFNKIHKSIFDDATGRQVHKDWKPYQGSQQSLEELNQLGYSIYFVTARMLAVKLVGEEKKSEIISMTNQWARRYFPYVEDILYSQDKLEYVQDFLCLLDDRGATCQNWIKAGGQAILYSQPINLRYRQSNIPVFKGWTKDSLLTYIEKLNPAR